MSVVAISQTLGSLGDEIGRALAGTLSYAFADREIILAAAERFGEGATDLELATEAKPTLWERFADTYRRYLAYVEAVILEMAARDNVVLVGRGAVFLLQKVRHALRVRISAPVHVRTNRAGQQQGLAPTVAAGLVEQSDQERAARIKFFYHVDWDDPLLYDLFINTDHLSVKEAVQLLQSALQGERFQPTPDSVAEVRDLGLTAQAKAALMMDPVTQLLLFVNPITRQLPLSVTCQKGCLTITGTVDREDQRTAVEAIASKLPGIAGVRCKIAVALPGLRPPGT